MNEALIRFKDVDVFYGVIHALHGITFDVPAGKILTLVGSNGAGKSSTLRALSGLIKVKNGLIQFKGEAISNLPAHEIVRKGISQAPEGRGIFLNLSVEENLDLGAWAAKDRSRFADDLDHAFQLFPRLKERRKQNAGTLSGGEQQMLAIARALMSQPEVLLLDEPSLGLAPQIIQNVFDIIVRINREGKTIFLVEQNARQALQIADYGIVLETGKIVIQGPARDLLHSDIVRKAYLGD